MGGTVKQDFPQRLKEAREMRGLTQGALAKKSGCISIAQFETGSRLPSAENIKKLAAALHVSADNLLGMPGYTAYGNGLTDEQLQAVYCLITFFRERNKDGGNES